MSDRKDAIEVKPLPGYESVGEALPLWTYASEELLELEYQAFFLK